MSVATLVLAGGAFGYLLGKQAQVSESDLITRAALDYVERTGGQALDCVGLPGQGDVWIVVRCAGAEANRVYAFDRSGRRVAPPEGPDA